MNIAAFSIKRPILITSIVILTLATGYTSLKKLGVDMFPDINIPVVAITTAYPGANPEEIENLISKPLESELSSLPGLKRLTSRNTEGLSIITCEFYLKVDIKDAEQQIRNRIGIVRNLLPTDIEEPLTRRFDPADQPVIRYALAAELPPGDLYDIAFETAKPLIEQADGVGAVTLSGGTRREIQIELDRNRLNQYQISASAIANQFKNFGINIPVGKKETDNKEIAFRALGRYDAIKQIEDTVVSFGNDVGSGIPLKKLGVVKDGTEDIVTKSFLYAPLKPVEVKHGLWNDFFGNHNEYKNLERVKRRAIFLDVFKQSQSNTVAVADNVRAKVEIINAQLKKLKGSPVIIETFDGSRWIRANIDDVNLSIFLGIILAVIIVYLFLGSIRSTIITGLALPNSLLGAFILMYLMGFTVNVMTLLALSLAVGLLVDDAIVVRENIFRKLEHGLHPVEAAERGTMEVAAAVVATTFTVVAVFMPVGFLGGMVGQFFKQFGLTIVFAMLISMFDALTIAPMLSAYFAGKVNFKPNIVIRKFEVFQKYLEHIYVKIMNFGLDKPWAIILISILIFMASIFSLRFVKGTFMSEQDQGEFMIAIELPPGTSLSATEEVLGDIESRLIKNIKELHSMTITAGSSDSGANIGRIGVKLIPSALREKTTPQIKEFLRNNFKDLTHAKVKVNDYAAVGGVNYPFNLVMKGDNLADLEKYATEIQTRLKKESKDLTDITLNFEHGKPEYQVNLEPDKLQMVGVASATAGSELRYHVQGGVVSKYHKNGIEYDIRMRLKPEQRDIKASFYETKVPNIQGRMVPLSLVGTGKSDVGPSKITRQNRFRSITIYGNLAKGGAIGTATATAQKIADEVVPQDGNIIYEFQGDAENFKELQENVLLAFGFALLFIYLVLASLYESFFTPIIILVAIPPAISGAFFALALTGQMFNIFSMIGLIMLMALVTKNSILLVDFAVKGVNEGMTRKKAIFEAGRARLRPILMTSFAMIAGTLPIAIGLGEASKTRTSMGVAIIGGLIVSTLLTLIVVPAIFEYMDILREKIEKRFRPNYDMRKVGNLKEASIMSGHEHADTDIDNFVETKVKRTKKITKKV